MIAASSAYRLVGGDSPLRAEATMDGLTRTASLVTVERSRGEKGFGGGGERDVRPRRFMWREWRSSYSRNVTRVSFMA